MNNWWIAALESAGIWTHEQAEHISNEIRNQIHSERYNDTLSSLKATIEKGDHFVELSAMDELKQELDEHRQLVNETLKEYNKVKSDIAKVQKQSDQLKDKLKKKIHSDASKSQPKPVPLTEPTPPIEPVVSLTTDPPTTPTTEPPF